MNPEEFQSFADNYTSADFDRIAFKWEGGYGHNFKEANGHIRVELCEYLLPNLHKVRLELIKDLYLEEGKTSDYTFGCYLRFYLLGQELLERGGTDYLTTYLQGAFHTMDTALTSSKVSLSRERAQELLACFDERMQNPANEEERKLYTDLFRRRFQREASK